MGLTATPQADRLWIGVFGRRNSGKSTLINALAGSEIALVSPEPGTTTDPVTKSIELHGIGPAVLVDTAGFDDTGDLGLARVARSRRALERIDLAILLLRPEEAETDFAPELDWIRHFAEQKADWLLVTNGTAADDGRIAQLLQKAQSAELPQPTAVLTVDAATKTGIDRLHAALVSSAALRRERARQSSEPTSITGELCTAGDLVLLVMPQDIQAPAGRLILPQVQTLRELLDKSCRVVAVTAHEYPAVLDELRRVPDLIITDSQVFPLVERHAPAASRLTSFSILMAAWRGDAAVFRSGADRLATLTEQSRLLIAESCAHVPQSEDIGRVQLPRLLRRRFGEGLTIDFASGADLPADLSAYDLIIHCGACMFNRAHVLARLGRFAQAGVPVTNYGMTLAWLGGILDRVDIPGLARTGEEHRK
ncbi:MAG: [FeFe] hydrogenase H-cluster maturation GTPase HydF [Bacillota bacterium]|nr:[FeFe] hydrogenase H-cluster maturation GTPase HydF [Bacillota bacterium]